MIGHVVASVPACQVRGMVGQRLRNTAQFDDYCNSLLTTTKISIGKMRIVKKRQEERKKEGKLKLTEDATEVYRINYETDKLISAGYILPLKILDCVSISSFLKTIAFKKAILDSLFKKTRNEEERA